MCSQKELKKMLVHAKDRVFIPYKYKEGWSKRIHTIEKLIKNKKNNT